MLNLTGKDVMGILEGQKVTRRARTYSDGSGPPEMWGVITGVVKHNTPIRRKLKANLVNTEPMALPVDGVNFPTVKVDTKDNYLYENKLTRDIPNAYGDLTFEVIPEE